MEILDKLNKICITKKNVNLKNLCSMHVGGIAEFVCYPASTKELKKLIKFILKKQINYYVMGNGSNIIFEDGGFCGIIVCLKKMSNFKIKKNTITVGAGLNLFALNNICKNKGIAGLEWSYGIPGSVGGAVCMNAGAYGAEIKDFIKAVWVLMRGKIKKLNKTEMAFSYRDSIIKGSKDIIIKAAFSLELGNKEDIESMQKQIFERRKMAQPYGTYNAGSIFKKTNGDSAGKTIDKLGLKNVKIGDIQISPVHANFFVNLGNGKSEDIHKLIDLTKFMAKEKADTILEEEVIFVGERKE